MSATVYIETTIASYLTARRTNDVIRQAQQELTTRWWEERRQFFSLYTSQFVLDESAAGDSQAAAARLHALAGIDLLDIGPEVEPLAQELLVQALPPRARVDALHLSVAALNGMEYLLTWNCKHLANAFLWPMISEVCEAAGVKPPTICTPYELMGEQS